MPAMVMPYKVQDLALLEGKKPGDMVTATLVVEEVDCLSVDAHDDRTRADQERRLPAPPSPTDPRRTATLVPDHAAGRSDGHAAVRCSRCEVIASP